MAVIIAACLWSLGGLGIKLVSADPSAIAGFRSLFALPVFLALRWWQRERFARPGPLIGVGALCYALTLILFVTANKFTTAANSILLQYTAPAYIILLSRPLLGERVGRWDALALCGCLTGLVFILHNGLGSGSVHGSVLALLSGGTLAAMTLSLRRLAQGPRTAGLDVMILGSLLVVGICAPRMVEAPPLPPFELAVLAGLGLVQIGAAYGFFLAGISRIPAFAAILFCALEPLLSPVWVYAVTGERPPGAVFLGGIFIVGSLIAHGFWRSLASGEPAADAMAASRSLHRQG